MVEKLVPEPFLKNQNCPYLWINSLKIFSLFLFYARAGDYQNVLKLRRWSLAFISYKRFLKKTKRGLKLVFLPHFLYNFGRNVFLTLHSINWRPIFIVWVSLRFKILGHICIVIMFPSWWRANFEINLNFLIEPFSNMTKTLREKCPNMEFFLVHIFLHLDWIRRLTE